LKRVARLGVLGGSFNPIHLGHLVIAERAVEALALDRLLLIPSADTPLKDRRTLAQARHRLAMARLAVRGNADLAVSDVEIRRGGTTYTVDTIEALRPLFRECFLIIGADSVASLPKWRRIRDLAKLVTFAIADRPGFENPAAPGYVRRIRVPAPRLDISASDLRRRIARGLSVRHLVPAAVERYIRSHGLYR
jgi:nicotinate-nucleotide adenylyltransferase